jgi:hypothetical protein
MNELETTQTTDLQRVLRPARTFIQQYGLNEAIVLEELVFRQIWMYKQHGRVKKRAWFFTPIVSTSDKKNQSKLPPLQLRFPWLSPKGIHRILNKIKDAKLIKINSFNRKWYDHTKWYTVPENVVRLVNAGHKLQLSLEDVLSFGPSAALVLNHVQYEMSRFDYEWLKCSPDRMIHLLPLSESTLKRALKKLVGHGELHKDGSEPYYKLNKANPCAGKICGKAVRDFKHEQEQICSPAIPELHKIKCELIQHFCWAANHNLTKHPLTLQEVTDFEEAALICYTNELDPTDFIQAQFKNVDPLLVLPWEPAMLIRDDVEQNCLQKYLPFEVHNT